MGRKRIPASEVADGFELKREVPPPKDMSLHKGKQIFRSRGRWQAERVVLMNDEIEWRLFWRGHHVVQRLGDMSPSELREWLITEIDELFEE